MVIKQGTHSPFRLFKPLIGVDTLKRKVTFTPTCRYELPEEDMYDINKLFGIGYFSWKFLYTKEVKVFGAKIKIPWLRPFHHVNSVRFGWRNIPSSGYIEIVAYWYENGKRKGQYITVVEIGVEYLFIINILSDSHLLTVYKDDSFVNDWIIPLPGKNAGYLLQPYFGGNNKAPHDIWIKMKK